MFLGQPTGGGACVRLHGPSANILLIEPVQGLDAPLISICGSGRARLEQNGELLSYQADSRVPTQAEQYTTTQQSITSAAVLPGPDLTIGTGDGTTTFMRLSQAGAVDWIGSIAPPQVTGPTSKFEAIVRLFNVAGSSVINIFDVSVGGGVRVPYPIVRLGWEESIDFVFDNFGWVATNYLGQWQLNGGSAGGGRSLITTDAAVHMLYQMASQVVGYTTGCGFTCDVIFRSSVGGAYYEFSGVSATWDPTDTIIFSSTPTTPVVAFQDGNAAGIALGLALTLDTAGGYNRLKCQNPAGTRGIWRVNNWRSRPGDTVF
jgi:hypothetical protein